MKRIDPGRGAYLMDYESFHHVYNFIRRTVERSKREVQTVLFTINSSNPNGRIETAETEVAVELLEQAIFTSLRRVDVSTRYSSRQVIVILLDSNSENGDMVAERVVNCFYKLYTGNNITIEYDIVEMDEGAKIPADKTE